MSKQAFGFAFVLLGLALLCTFVLLALMPNLEMGRNESRSAVAYHDVRRIHDELSTRVSIGTLSETDPWDTPYRVTKNDGQVRVTSAGPDTTFERAGTGGDDIHSDMASSPGDQFARQRNWQWLAAFAITGTVFGGVTLYWRFRRQT